MKNFKKLSLLLALVFTFPAFAQVQVYTGAIEDNSVTNSKLADVNGYTIKMRNSPISGNPTDITISDLGIEAVVDSGDFALCENDSGELKRCALDQTGDTNAATICGPDLLLDGDGDCVVSTIADTATALSKANANESSIASIATEQSGQNTSILTLNSRADSADTERASLDSRASNLELSDTTQASEISTLNTNVLPQNIVSAIDAQVGNVEWKLPSSADLNGIYDGSGVLSGPVKVETGDETFFIARNDIDEPYLSISPLSDTAQIRSAAGAIVETVSNGIGLIIPANGGLSVGTLGAVGGSGQVITSNGVGVAPSWQNAAIADGNGIYDGTGSLTENANVALSSFNFNVQGSENPNGMIYASDSANEAAIGNGQALTDRNRVSANDSGINLLISATDSLLINGVSGTAGQSLLSNGVAPPTWGTPAGDGNGILDGGSKSGAATTSETNISQRISFKNEATGSLMLQMNPLSPRLILANGSAANNTMTLRETSIDIVLQPTSPFKINTSSGLSGQVFNSNGDLLAPSWSYPKQSEVSTAAPSGVLGQYYTDDSGAFCWHDGTVWVLVAGSGACS